MIMIIIVFTRYHLHKILNFLIQLLKLSKWEKGNFVLKSFSFKNSVCLLKISKRGGGLRTQYCLVTRDFLGSKSDDLPIKRGEVVTIVAQDSHDWIRGVCKGLEGYFPESFVIIPGPDDYLMRVTHSYSGNADSVDELSLVKEQVCK